jgi:murein DD-endopeptidase MepM/ murein hydrolase activator NlpD
MAGAGERTSKSERRESAPTEHPSAPKREDPLDLSWLDDYSGVPPPRPSWRERHEQRQREKRERFTPTGPDDYSDLPPPKTWRQLWAERREAKKKERWTPPATDDYSHVEPPPPQVQKKLVEERPARRERERRRAVLARRRRGLSRLAILAVSLLGTGLLLNEWFGVGLGSDRTASSSLVPGQKFVGSTAEDLTAGPYFPAHGKFYYGEEGAKFGASRGGRSHEGQDVFARSGAPLIAVRNGVVVDRGGRSGQYSGGRGNYIAIYSPEDNHSYVYLHMLRPSKLKNGDEVKAGQQIGQMGCSGSCFGVHLHFEIRVGRATLRSDTKPIDPLPFLKRWDKIDSAALKTSFGRL